MRPRPEGAAAEMFREWSANTGPGSVGFSVCSLATDELVGHATLYGAALPWRAGTLAILLGPDFTDRGLGTDAVRTLVRYGFLEMALNQIELRVWAFNARARRAYAKAGFVEEGVRRQVVFHDGEFHDEVIMAVLAAEWRAAQPS
ncbi:GNAT family N-acetyltransferase [Frondihabitans cladoniiphilus]|uniref:GNAT family N-acetyltransferase n=1 Tax=Frondihabitans cladoniiphilus TaxID=715785 RepID=UPI0031E58A33